MAGVIAASSVIMLAGCTGANSGPKPPSEPSPPSPTHVGHPGPADAAQPIPPVKNPRDVAAVSGRPCDLLTSQQASGFRLDMSPNQLSGVRGTVRCMWTTTTIPERAIVRMVDVSASATSPAFEVIYDKNRGLPFFELTDIAGYPAIVTRTNLSLPICAIKIKTAEGQSLSVDYEDKDLTKDPQKSCEIGKQVAAAALMNVPTKS